MNILKVQPNLEEFITSNDLCFLTNSRRN